jgi:hypothetical protein
MPEENNTGNEKPPKKRRLSKKKIEKIKLEKREGFDNVKHRLRVESKVRKENDRLASEKIQEFQKIAMGEIIPADNRTMFAKLKEKCTEIDSFAEQGRKARMYGLNWLKSVIDGNEQYDQQVASMGQVITLKNQFPPAVRLEALKVYLKMQGVLEPPTIQVEDAGLTVKFEGLEDVPDSVYSDFRNIKKSDILGMIKQADEQSDENTEYNEYEEDDEGDK